MAFLQDHNNLLVETNIRIYIAEIPKKKKRSKETVKQEGSYLVREEKTKDLRKLCLDWDRMEFSTLEAVCSDF